MLDVEVDEAKIWGNLAGGGGGGIITPPRNQEADAEQAAIPS